MASEALWSSLYQPAESGGVDRRDQVALRSLRSGMPLVIFPEGGRSPNGDILPFLPGAFFLAIKAQADIVPIALVELLICFR